MRRFPASNQRIPEAVDHDAVKKRRLGALLAGAAGALWGTAAVVGKAVFRLGVSPADAALWRAGGGFLVLMLAALVGRRSTLRIHAADLPLFTIWGLCGVALFFSAYFYAIQLTSVTTAVILLYTYPAWVMLLARPLFGEPVTGMKVAALLLAVAGSVLVVRGYDPAALRLNWVGVLLGLTASLAGALQSIFGKWALRRYAPFTSLLYSLGFGALFLALTIRRWPAPPSTSALLLLLYLAVVPSVLAVLLLLMALTRIEAGRAAVIAVTEPIVAVLLGVLVFREVLEPAQWLGALLVLSGVTLIQR